MIDMKMGCEEFMEIEDKNLNSSEEFMIINFSIYLSEDCFEA